MGTACQDAPPLVDLGDCEDIFLSGLAQIETLPGNCLRFTWYVEETHGGITERRVKLRAIVPLDALVPAIATINAAIAELGTPMASIAGVISHLPN